MLVSLSNKENHSGVNALKRTRNGNIFTNTRGYGTLQNKQASIFSPLPLLCYRDNCEPSDTQRDHFFNLVEVDK